MLIFTAVKLITTRVRHKNMGSAISYVTGGSGTAVIMANVDEVQQMIKSGKVVIFSKSYCPYCKLAKEVFKRLKQNVTVFELDERDDGAPIQKTLGEITGSKTVPQVFIDGSFVGGGSDVEKMEKQGTLQPMLAG